MLTKRSSQKRRINNTLYESIMNDVSKVVKRHLNEDVGDIKPGNPNAYKVYPGNESQFVQNLSNKQRNLLEYLSNYWELSDNILSIYYVRGRNSLNEIIDEIDEENPEYTSLEELEEIVPENEIGLLVLLDLDGSRYLNYSTQSPWIFFDTSKIRDNSRDEYSQVYSVHVTGWDNDTDIPPLILTYKNRQFAESNFTELGV